MSKSDKFDVYTLVTEKIIAKMEEGIVPWVRPWNMLPPVNAVSKKKYKGINFLLLSMSEYTDARWLTYKQAQSLGGSVKKGEKSTQVIFWKMLEVPREDSDAMKILPLLRYYSVFNAEQCEGLQIPSTKEYMRLRDNEEHIEADAIIAAMPNPPKIEHGGSRACYFPQQDLVKLPARDSFRSSEAYYAIKFHELVHSTGHQTRLKRPGITDWATFGDSLYSQEELVAELGAAFLCAIAGIDNTTEDTQRAAYIGGWLKALKNDKRMIVTAASAAQKAVNYVTNKSQDLEVEQVA